MTKPNFNQLLENAALTLYAAYLQSANISAFLKEKLPLKYGVGKGYLINKKKEISKENIFIYDQLIAPKLLLGGTNNATILPANTVYSNVSFFSELNQSNLDLTLQSDRQLSILYNNQLVDSQQDIRLLNIWIATDLAPFITLNDLEDRLLAEETTPDLIVIMNRGVLAILNEHTIQNIFDLSAKKSAQSYDRAIAANLVNIAHKTMQGKYMKLGADAAYKNCFYGYILLLELLKNQDLPADGLAPEMASIW